MPVPGPRNQFGPDSGYRNPGLETPDRINMWKRPGPIYWPGRTPGLMIVTLRGCVLAAGQVRRFWRQSIDLIPAQAPFSWTANGLNADGQPHTTESIGVTRALRYKTQSTYEGAGIDNSRYAALHTIVRKQNAYKRVTVAAGSVRGRPTVRNRLTSFGSRVPTLNQAVQAAETQSPGGATQA